MSPPYKAKLDAAASDIQSFERLTILVGASVRPDPNAGASGTIWQMNAALRRRGHLVDEIWADELGRRIHHGNLHCLLELPGAYSREVHKACAKQAYDVIELNQPHAFWASRDHLRRQRPGVFVNRSHGHETRSEEDLDSWRHQLGIRSNHGPLKIASGMIRRLLEWHWRSIARTADGFVVSSVEDAEFLNSRYGVQQARIGLITQGVPQAYLDRPVAPMNMARLQRILYVGQLAFFKAPHVLAESLNLILRKNANATATWVCGALHHPQAIQMFSEDIRQRVTLVNWMDQAELLPLLDDHGTFVFPSYFEGFDKAPLEAMARGLCVTASNVGGMRDYIDDGVSGRLVPPGDAAVFANTALNLMSNVARATEMSRAARAVAEQHTWDRCAADVEVFYRRLLSLKLPRVKARQSAPTR